MPQPIPSPAQEAAAAIVRLINASPRSPRLDEIEAVIAKAVSSLPEASAGSSLLLPKIRETVARLNEAFDIQGKVQPSDKAANEATQARIDEFQDALEELEDQIPSPARSFSDLVAWAEIAQAGADVRRDGTMAEAEEEDVFLRPAARLVEAVLQFRGACSATAMSPAHAEQYREQRCLVDQHFKPAINPETGKPLSFDYTNDEFASSFLPSIRLAFCIMGRDRDGVIEFVRGLTEDPNDPEGEALFDLLDNWKIVQNKFEAIAGFAEAACARVMAVGMSIGEQQAKEAAP